MTSGDPEAGDHPGEASGVALLVIDMLNDLAFPQAGELVTCAPRIAGRIAELRDAADASRSSVVYVNDNYGQWHWDRQQILDHSRREGSAGREMADRLAPRDRDFFVIKPQFSGFYATTLPALLPRLGVRRLILTGIAADICVLFTAADAHMREYEIWVPEDAVASENRQRTEWALEIMRGGMAAETRATDALSIDGWLAALNREDQTRQAG